MLWSSIIIVVCASGALALARGPKLETLRLICLPGVPLPVAIASRSGIFAKYGIEVHAERASDANAVRADLTGAKADIAHASVENAVVMDDTRQADVIIVMGGEGSTSELIAQPDIKSVKELSGRTIITDGTDTAYTLTLKKILLLNGLKPGTDCEIKVIGVATARLSAMTENKQYAATIQKPPTSILAVRAGMVSLGLTEDLLKAGPSQGIGAFVQRQWAHDHAELLERYIAAFVEAQRWLMSPANKEQTIELIMKDAHLPEDVAAETYEINMKSGWTEDARFEAKGFEDDLKLKVEFDSSSTGKPPAAENYYDLSYYQKSLVLLKSKQ
jgi:NitT/TauT family transport system substrate-binding protein